MKKRKVKTIIAAMLLAGITSITALAASNTCVHSYQNIGGVPLSNWNTSHYVSGPEGAELCNVLHIVYRYYFQCNKCGHTFTMEDSSYESHSNTHCPRR